MNVHQDLYTFFNQLNLRFHPRDYVWDYRNASPVPWIALDNFLPQHLFDVVSQEYHNIPDHHWTHFTRNGSFMRETKSWSHSGVLQTLAHCFNSGPFLDWLEALTGINKIISDPHYIGAGVSVTPTGQSLKLHTDFNWNDELALNRCLSLILYINSDWQESWGGNLEFWDFERKTLLHRIAPYANRLLIWNYDEKLVHGYPQPIQCPEDNPRITLRIFYYQSNATPLSKPHRSLYWVDDKTNTPYDDRSQT